MPPLVRRSLTITILAIAASIAAVLLLPRIAQPVRSVVASADSLRWPFLGVGLALTAGAMVNRGLLNRAAHRAAGLDARTTEMVATAAVGFSAQKIVRSGGLSGLAVFVHHGRRRGFGPGAVTAACAFVAGASMIGLGVLVAAAIVVLAATGRLTGWWLAAGIGFAAYVVAVAAGVVVLSRQRMRLERWVFRLRRLVARVRRRPRPVPDRTAIDELFAAAQVARRRPTEVSWVVVHAIAGKAFGALILFSAASAAGLVLTPLDAVVVYATALGASLVAIVPGGVGVVEASTAALLVAGGASGTAAAVTVALFRLLDSWIPLLAGVAAARGSLRERATESVSETPAPVTSAAVAAA